MTSEPHILHVTPNGCVSCFVVCHFLSFSVQLSGSTALACAIGGKGGEHGESARLLRAAGGVDSLGTVMDSPRCMLDVPLRQPRRAIDDIAEDLGRMTFTGQF